MRVESPMTQNVQIHVTTLFQHDLEINSKVT